MKLYSPPSAPDECVSRTAYKRHGEGWGNKQHFCLSLHWQLLFLYLSSHKISRKGLEEWSTACCRRRPGLRPSEEFECAHVHGIQWDVIQDLWGNQQIKFLSHYPPYLKSCGSQVKFSVTGKGEAKHLFLKRVKKRTQWTTDWSASPLCPVSSWSSWKLC